MPGPDFRTVRQTYRVGISKSKHISTTLMINQRVPTELRQELKPGRMRAEQPIALTRDILIQRKQNNRSKGLVLNRISRRRQRLLQTPQRPPIALPRLVHERQGIFSISESH